MELKSQHLMPKYHQSLLQIGELISPSQRGYLQKTCWAHGTGRAAQETAPHPERWLVDCIVLAQKKLDLDVLRKQLTYLTEMLTSDGQISILFAREQLDSIPLKDLDCLLAMHGLLRFRSGPVAKAIGQGLLGALVAVKSSYDPVRHARGKALLGRIDEAVEILKNIPINLLPSNDALAELSLERQRYYLNWQRLCTDKQSRHRFFGPERRQFAQVTALQPHRHATYLLHAEFWSHLGRHDMAARLLRSLNFAVPNRESQLLLNYYENMPSLITAACNDDLPFWRPTGRSPRILVLTHDYSDYGMDTLYHGLCNVVGTENVVEFPWKATLHNQGISGAENYPCVFDFPGTPYAVIDLVKELEMGRFDMVLYADVVQMTHRKEVRQIMQAASGLPVVLYDSWDEAFTPMDMLLDYIGRDRFDVVFKRELLAGIDLDYNPYPLPFGYPLELASEPKKKDRGEPIFWAGKKDYGLRPLYVERLERRMGRDLGRSYSQEEYRQALCRSRIGLSFFGCGFDTVRYWEVPANKVMLLSERLPIRIPYNFKDGVSAVFFDDLEDMESKLDYYLNHPEACERIAAAGRLHFKKYHTTTARAQQFLGVVSKALGWNAESDYAA